MDSKVYPVPAAARERALVTSEDYDRLYQQSVEDNEGFWREQGQRLDWFKPYTQVRDVSFDKNNLHI